MSTRAARSRHPVIIATGEKSLDQLDFQLPGPIQLEWRRQYRSGDARSDGWFGQGWSHPLATELWVQEDVLRYWDEQGREVLLPAIAVGQEHFEAYEQFTLTRPAVNRWALRHNRGLTHHFRRRNAAQWRLPLEVVRDRNHWRLLLQFDDGDFAESFDEQAAPPRPHCLIDSAGRKLHLVWTEQRQLDRVVVESGDTHSELASYRYGSAAIAAGGLPDLLSHTDANGHTRTFSWEQHLLVGYTLATGQRFSNRYDRLTPTGRVTESLALDDGTGDWFDYNGQTTRVRDRLGRETVYVHNARQDIVAVHDAAGNVTRHNFDDQGRAEESIDPLGRSGTTRFDRRGNLTLAIDAAGNTTTFEYSALDLPTKLTDAMGGEWLRQYDERGNVVASTDPLGHTMLYELDDRGQITAVIDAMDKRKTLEWDDAGNLVAYTDCSGRTSRQTYDALGRLASSTDAAGRRTDYAFDAAGQLRRVIRPDGAVQRYSWDGQGNLVQYVDPLGQAITWQYDGAGRLLHRNDPLGHALHYRYDGGGRLETLTNEAGAVTRFSHDLLDRLTDEIGVDGRHQRYAYNVAGEMTHLIERGGSDFGPGKVTAYERDALGRVTAKHHVGEHPDDAASSRFAYDALGRLTQAANAVSSVQFAYDPLGQLLSETQTLHGRIGEQVFAFEHRYDALGNRIRTTLPDGRELHQLFYGSSHLHQINLDGKVVSDFERDEVDREVRRSQGGLHSEFAYDQAGRLRVHRVLRSDAAGTASSVAFGEIGSGLDAGPWDDVEGRFASLIERRYDYDPNGRVIRSLDRRRGRRHYVYDASDRIVLARVAPPTGKIGHPAMAADEAFHWDAAGNALPADIATSPIGGAGIVSGNRLQVREDVRYTYDDHGNLIERLQGKRDSPAQTRTRFAWDAAHQLVGAEVTRGLEGVARAQAFAYAYDALGRRIAKVDAFGCTLFAWNGDRMTHEQRGGNSTTHLYHPESFVPLAQIHDGELHYLHTDQLGTPLEASNEAGEITWSVTYRTWGNVVVEEVRQIEQRLRFQGQYFDAETGLHYNRFRYYEPESGRFVSQDPIGLNGGTNLFAYAPNPINWTDPRGLACCRQAANAKQAHAAIMQQWGYAMNRNDMLELHAAINRVVARDGNAFPGNDNVPYSNNPAAHADPNRDPNLPPPQVLDSGGCYTEFTVRTPNGGRARRRIVADYQKRTAFYSHDHYDSFIDISKWVFG